MNNYYGVLLATLALALLFVPGCNEELSTTAIIADPVASFTYSGTPTTPAAISFQNTSKNSNIYLWEFGDGTVSQASNPTKTYNRRGVYTVRLIALNTNAKSDAATQQIIVTPGKVFMDSLIVDRVPFVDVTGVPWDTDSSIDLYVDLVDIGGATHLTTILETLNDVTPANLPVSWRVDPPFQIEVWNESLRMRVWDNDLGNFRYYIGETGKFFIATIIADSGYVRTLRLQNRWGTISVRIILKWQ